MSELNDLYQELILDHKRHPRNFRDMPDATRAVDGHNPLCGDQSAFTNIRCGSSARRCAGIRWTQR